MKVVRTIFSAVACFIIAIGIFSVIGYELYFRHAAPVLPSQQTTEQPQEQQTPEPETQPTVQTFLTEELQAYEQQAQEMLSGLTLEQKLYQMFFVTPESLTGVEAATRAGDATKTALLDNPVGGILYSEKNLEDEAQVKALLSGTQDFLKDGGKMPAFLAIDEEGGDIAPVASALETMSFPTMAEIGKSEDTDTANRMGETIAQELSALGFNVNFAPIADLSDETRNPVIGSRSFGDDPVLTAAMISSTINGTQSNGVLNAVAHFPGLGSLEDEAHISRERIELSLDEMEQTELVPFRAAIENNAGFIIVSHALLTSLDDQRPCSMSQRVMELLRNDLGYHGIIMTDVLDALAITDHYTAADAAVNAVSAGADMLLCPEDLDDAIEALLDAVESGTIPESRIDESVVRILAAKIRLGLLP